MANSADRSRGQKLRRSVGATAATLLVLGCLAILDHPWTVSAGQGSSVANPSTSQTRATLATTTAAPTTVETTTLPPTTASTAPAPMPTRWRIGATTLQLVDASRPTPPTADDPGSPARALPTVVLYPTDGSPDDPPVVGAAPASRGGPFPLIVFAHGFNTTPEVYASLLDTWAAAGYVVAAPEFPRSVSGAHLDESDLDHQPGDVSFVISRILAGALPTGLVDGRRIGVAGHSDGGVTAVGVGYNTCCHDTRISADVVMAGDAHDFAGGRYFASGTPPLLVIQGDQDPSNDPSLGQQLYQAAPSPKVLIMLLGALHLPPFTTDLPHLGVVETATLGFFDHYLKGRADGLTRVAGAARAPLATISTG